MESDGRAGSWVLFSSGEFEIWSYPLKEEIARLP